MYKPIIGEGKVIGDVMDEKSYLWELHVDRKNYRRIKKHVDT